MADFQQTPEDVPTGTYQDAVVDETETVEEWIHMDVTTDDGGTEERAFGFILIPAENVSWDKKNTIIQEVAASSAGNFDAVDYYKRMFAYQVQETNFLPDHKTVEDWLDDKPNPSLVDKLEPHVPSPLDLGEEGIAESVLEIMEEYAESDEGSWDATLEHFRSWLQNKAGVGEGDEGK